MRLRAKVKRGKKKARDVDVVFAAFGGNHHGEFFWRLDGSPEDVHGPFASMAEAEEDFRVTVFGPQCRIIERGVPGSKAVH
jgi:hypothetical protein